MSDMLISHGGCKLYAPRCPMCLDYDQQFEGFCSICYRVCRKDAAERGIDAADYCAELWANYDYLYGMKASTEMAERLQLHLALAPKPGETKITIRPGAASQQIWLRRTRTPAVTPPATVGSCLGNMP